VKVKGKGNGTRLTPRIYSDTRATSAFAPEKPSTLRQALTIGFSPCPNDTFIFYDLLHAPSEIEFYPVTEDVEALNRRALAHDLDITKVSIAVYPLIKDNYVLLDSGAALGYNCGPILITKPGNDVSEIGKCLIAIPGEHTTANLLLTKAFPNATNKKEMLFSEIEDALLGGKVEAGVIIHESRFTYEAQGLTKVVDLGEWWHEKTQMPIPLGGIVAKRSLGQKLISRINSLIRNSVQFALDNPEEPMPYVQQHAQEMDEEVMRQHIALYVNTYSVSMGEQGLHAVNQILTEAPVSANL